MQQADSNLALRFINAEDSEAELQLLSENEKQSLLLYLFAVRDKHLEEKKRYYARKKHAGCKDQRSTEGEG